jgi:hypothetical protein
MKTTVELSGINVQQPWARLLLGGGKTIETRFYPLPQKHMNKPLAIIETPGAEGDFNARIIGIVLFGKPKEYKSEAQFKRDLKKHLVSGKEGLFSWRTDKKKWGWPVTWIAPLSDAIPAPKPRGIVFCSKCSVPLKLLSEADSKFLQKQLELTSTKLQPGV